MPPSFLALFLYPVVENDLCSLGYGSNLLTNQYLLNQEVSEIVRIGKRSSYLANKSPPNEWNKSNE